MCDSASMWITEFEVYWSKNSDSHEDIRDEFKLQESIAGTINICKVEIVPPNKDYSLPLDQWVFSIEQDEMPRWFDREKDEKRARETLKEWAKHKLKTRVEQGNSNTGDRNTGNWNATDFSSGVFCFEEQKIKIFDIQTDLTYRQWLETKQSKLLSRLILIEWIFKSDMTDEEKSKYPEARYLGGYLKRHEWKESCLAMWNKFAEEEKECIKQIPNFDAYKFEKITGIKV